MSSGIKAIGPDNSIFSYSFYETRYNWSRTICILE
jgi:hypothetical protein